MKPHSSINMKNILLCLIVMVCTANLSLGNSMDNPLVCPTPGGCGPNSGGGGDGGGDDDECCVYERIVTPCVERLGFTGGGGPKQLLTNGEPANLPDASLELLQAGGVDYVETSPETSSEWCDSGMGECDEYAVCVGGYGCGHEFVTNIVRWPTNEPVDFEPLEITKVVTMTHHCAVPDSTNFTLTVTSIVRVINVDVEFEPWLQRVADGMPMAIGCGNQLNPIYATQPPTNVAITYEFADISQSNLVVENNNDVVINGPAQNWLLMHVDVGDERFTRGLGSVFTGGGGTYGIDLGDLSFCAGSTQRYHFVSCVENDGTTLADQTVWTLGGPPEVAVFEDGQRSNTGKTVCVRALAPGTNTLNAAGQSVQVSVEEPCLYTMPQIEGKNIIKWSAVGDQRTQIAVTRPVIVKSAESSTPPFPTTDTYTPLCFYSDSNSVRSLFWYPIDSPRHCYVNDGYGEPTPFDTAGWTNLWTYRVNSLVLGSTSVCLQASGLDIVPMEHGTIYYECERASNQNFVCNGKMHFGVAAIDLDYGEANGSPQEEPWETSHPDYRVQYATYFNIAPTNLEHMQLFTVSLLPANFPKTGIITLTSADTNMFRIYDASTNLVLSEQHQSAVYVVSNTTLPDTPMRFYMEAFDVVRCRGEADLTVTYEYTDGSSMFTMKDEVGITVEYADTDEDGLSNWLEEERLGTDPGSDDTDDDGIPDGWEYANGLNPVLNDGIQNDPDFDGLNSYEESLLGTDPEVADTDGDGLSDGDEVNKYHTYPKVADTDGDGLSDGDEVNMYHTYPKVADTDGDGLSDGYEVTTSLTYPKVADTDGDRISDGDEVNLYKSDPNRTDTDDDDLSDYEEVYVYHTDLLKADTDDDGLTDGDEVITHDTDPLYFDSDHDQMPDGWEVANGLNPLDSQDAMTDQDGDGYPSIYECRHGSQGNNKLSIPPVTIYVSPIVVGEEYGSLANPYSAIQIAIEHAEDHDVVGLLPGVYDSEGDRDVIFVGKSVMLVAIENAETTVIDCQNAGRAFVFNNGTEHTIVDGVTIKNGMADHGGAFSVTDTSVRFQRCIMVSNIAENAGDVIYLSGANGQFKHCVMWHNGTTNSASTIAEVVSTSRLELVHCSILENLKMENAEATYINIEGDCSSHVINSVIWQDDASWYSGPVVSENNLIQDIYMALMSTRVTTIFHHNSYHLRYDFDYIDEAGYTTPLGPVKDIDGDWCPAGFYSEVGADEYVDMDSDGIADWWEFKYFGSTGTAAGSHSDGDDLPNLEEYRAGTNPLDEDSDDDGLLDSDEAYSDGTHRDTDGWVTNPNEVDTDGDGVNDDVDPYPTAILEIALEQAPVNLAGNDISNRVVFSLSCSTAGEDVPLVKPLVVTLSGNAFVTGVADIGVLLEPVTLDVPVKSITVAPWNESVSWYMTDDLEEIVELNVTDTNGYAICTTQLVAFVNWFSDLDNDGLNIMQEYEAGCDPTVADSDGDGLKDGADAWPIRYTIAECIFPTAILNGLAFSNRVEIQLVNRDGSTNAYNGSVVHVKLSGAAGFVGVGDHGIIEPAHAGAMFTNEVAVRLEYGRADLYFSDPEIEFVEMRICDERGLDVAASQNLQHMIPTGADAMPEMVANGTKLSFVNGIASINSAFDIPFFDEVIAAGNPLHINKRAYISLTTNSFAVPPLAIPGTEEPNGWLSVAYDYFLTGDYDKTEVYYQQLGHVVAGNSEMVITWMDLCYEYNPDANMSCQIVLQQSSPIVRCQYRVEEEHISAAIIGAENSVAAVGVGTQEIIPKKSYAVVWTLSNAQLIEFVDKDADSDEDGLVNADEVAYGTDLYNSDTDDDGVSDGKEVAVGTDPVSAASKPGSISGVASGGGHVEGTVYILAVTNAESWDMLYSAEADLGETYQINDVPNNTLYWVKAFKDSNTNGVWELGELAGMCEDNPVTFIDTAEDTDINLGESDHDADGLPDWWELKNGLNPGLQDDAFVDHDYDGYLTIYEYTKNTDTRDMTDRPAADFAVSSTNSEVSIQNAIDSVSNAYTIIRLQAGVYTNAGDRNISFGSIPCMIISEGGAASCIIDCQNKGSAFVFDGNQHRGFVINGISIMNGVADQGGAVYCWNASPSIYNCYMTGNHAYRSGGAVYCENASPLLSGCTIRGNVAELLGGGFYLEAGEPEMANTILWGNAAENIHIESGNPAIHDSCIREGYASGQNITTNDPQFYYDGFHLFATNSPCVNAGIQTTAIELDGEPRWCGEHQDIGVDEFLDSESDGIPDWWESKYGLSVTLNDSLDDSDGDGLLNLDEYKGNSNPNSSSSSLYTVSGTITYDGEQNGTVYVIADVTENAGENRHFLELSYPSYYALHALPAPTNYWLLAYCDANTNGQCDTWEAYGAYLNNSLYLDVNRSGIDIELTDPDRDGDALPDWWEQLIIDDQQSDLFRTIEDVTPDDDYDKDGASNKDEYAWETDPVDILSVPPLVSFGEIARTLMEPPPDDLVGIDYQVPILMSKQIQTPADVEVVVSGGTAREGNDYLFVTPQRVLFGIGETSKTVTITVLSDYVIEPQEACHLTLDVVAGCVAGQRSEFILTIEDNNEDPNSDGDCMPDWWEIRFLGSKDGDGTGDPDHDGLDNCQEFNLGSNPTIPALEDVNDLTELQVLTPWN